MKSESSIYKDPVARKILDYLVQNPQADDTVEGIAKWWLLEQRIRHSVSEVEAALSDAASKSLIVTRKGADGRTHYRVNPEKEKTIREHLGSSPGRKRKRTK